MDVQVRPVSEVTDLTLSQAVVMGSAVPSGKWLPEAVACVDHNQTSLLRMPTAVFQVCMLLATGKP